MPQPNKQEDTRPWHRQFWPWFLIALPASVVAAGLVTLFIANRHADDLVVDEYYRDGLAINRQLERKQQALELDLSAQIRIDGQSLLVDISGPVSGNSLTLHLSHPMEAARDISLVLHRTGSGLFASPLTQAVAPHWHWVLEPTLDEGWRLDGSLTADNFEHALSN